MKKSWVILLVIVVIAALATGIFYWQYLQGAWTALRPAAGDIASLTFPQGFSLSVFAKNLPGARVMAFDSSDNLWVSQSSQGTVAMLEIEEGRVKSHTAVFRNLNNPHGLAFDPDNPQILYIAQEDQISKARLGSEAPLEKIADLPSGGGHSTRTIAFGPDKRLYVSIGSSCNVCHESDSRRASILFMNKDGSNVKTFAKGLRNSVFFTWHPQTQQLWATDMGRDLLGDDLPPDEINIIKEGGNYGWPICYGENIHDAAFDKNTYVRNPCMEPFEIPSYIDIPAHSAPLGLAFTLNQGWPKEYANNLLVAYHGSWNRSTPTGYKVVRFMLDNGGNVVGQQNFITGWLNKNNTSGRPVDLVITSQGLFISDDKAGAIYLLTPTRSK